MPLPTITGTARLTDDPELRFAASGTAVCKIRLAFNSRKLNPQTQQWEDDKVGYIDGVLFKQAAENAAEALTRGTEVVVTGRYCTEQWVDKQTGDKRSKPSLLIDSIGPAVNNYQTAKVSKLERSSGGNGNQGSSQRQAADDPWASAAPASQSKGFEDEPPF